MLVMYTINSSYGLGDTYRHQGAASATISPNIAINAFITAHANGVRVKMNLYGLAV